MRRSSKPLKQWQWFLLGALVFVLVALLAFATTHLLIMLWAPVPAAVFAGALVFALFVNLILGR